MKPLFRITGLLLIAWLAFSIGMNTPFFGHHDGSGIWISAAVRNFDLYGASRLGFVPVVDRGLVTGDNFLYYVHHPPLIVWITAAMAQMAGLNDLTVRFVAAALSLISVAGVYAIAKRLFDLKTAFWVVVFYLLTPMILYYGRSPNHEPLSLVIIALYAAVLLSGRRSPTRGKLAVLSGLALLAGLSSWAAMLGVGMMTALAFLTVGSTRWRFVPLGIALLIGLALTAALYQHQVSGAISEVVGAFGYRVSAYEYYDQTAAFDLGKWTVRQILDVSIFLMPGLILLGVIGTWRTIKGADRFSGAVVVALWLTGIGYVLLLRNAAFEHDFYKIFLTLPLALCAAPLFVRMVQPPRKRIASVGLALCIASWIGGVIVWAGLQSMGRDAVAGPMQIVETLDTISEPETALVTNMDNLPIGVDYYAFRNIDRQNAAYGINGSLSADVILMDCLNPTPMPIEGQIITQDDVCTYWRQR